MPKWAYRRVRANGARKPDPVRVSGDRAYQTSRQVTKHFLCQDCEQSFGRREKYVAEIAKQADGSFPFHRRLTQVHGQIWPEAALVELAEVDWQKLAFFALSVLWRHDTMAKSIDLGPYQEAIRLYLLGQEAQPEGVFVVVGALVQHPEAFDLDLMFMSPTIDRIGWYRLYAFAVCGLEFLVPVGKLVPEWVQATCALRSPSPRAIFATSRASRSAQSFLRAARDALANKR